MARGAEVARMPRCAAAERRKAGAPWHESEAAADEAAGRWFAAAFHLRRLNQGEPENHEWQQRWKRAKEHLAK